MDDGCKNGMTVGGMEKVVGSRFGCPLPFPFFVYYFPFSYPTFISPFSLDDILCS